MLTISLRANVLLLWKRRAGAPARACCCHPGLTLLATLLADDRPGDQLSRPGSRRENARISAMTTEQVHQAGAARIVWQGLSSHACFSRQQHGQPSARPTLWSRPLSQVISGGGSVIPHMRHVTRSGAAGCTSSLFMTCLSRIDGDADPQVIRVRVAGVRVWQPHSHVRYAFLLRGVSW